MRRIVARGVKQSEIRRRPTKVASLPRPEQPKKRPVADGPATQGTPPSPPPERKSTPVPRPARTMAQARKDANNVRVVAESLREADFLACLQRGAPELVHIYISTKSKSRGCGGCGMKSLFRMVHDEIVRRREQPALADAVAYLRGHGWS